MDLPMYSLTTFIGTVTIFVGITLVVIAILMLLLNRGKASVRGGGVIMIGPIPIIFGSDPKTVKWLIILAIFLMIIALITILLPAFLPH
jgi:uncharacterized protein (TIGR00304 family)